MSLDKLGYSTPSERSIASLVRAWISPFLGVGFLAACSGEATEGEFLVRDSSGILIVASSVPRWEQGLGWSIESAPAVRIGSTEGEDPYLLFRVSDGTVLSDGRIVVLNAGTPELRVFSRVGEFLSSIGREGDGPGEFRFPRYVFGLPGDSIVVVGIDRVSTFDPEGGFAEAWNYGPPSAVARFPDGSLVGKLFAPGVNPYELGLTQPRLSLVRMGPDGASRDTIAEVSGDEAYRSEEAGGISSSLRPFGLTRSVVADQDRIYTGDGSSFEIHVLGGGGGVRTIIRREADLTLHPSAQAVFEETYLQDDLPENVRRRREHLLRELPYPDRMPAFDRLLIDEARNLWARHFPIAAKAQEWSVFDQNGQWLGIVNTPLGLRVFEIGDDYVLGRTTDFLDVEYVQLHVLQKPG